jgi:hypothetical protein
MLPMGRLFPTAWVPITTRGTRFPVHHLCILFLSCGCKLNLRALAFVQVGCPLGTLWEGGGVGRDTFMRRVSLYALLFVSFVDFRFSLGDRLSFVRVIVFF